MIGRFRRERYSVGERSGYPTHAWQRETCVAIEPHPRTAGNTAEVWVCYVGTLGTVMPLSVDQVLELAPDAASATSGKKLSSTQAWKSAGRNDAALWGECVGWAVYQVRVSCADWSYKCSCPSRKFPCKHVLGLLLMAAQDPEALAVGDAPQWVVEWLGKREAAARVRETRKEKEPAVVADPAAAARRAATREQRVAEGIERLELWLRDLVRNGLAGLEGKPFSFWDGQAAGLIDAQAPGLAARVRTLGAIPGSSPDWPVRLAEGLGRLALLLRAYRRLAELSPPMQAEVRTLVGWTVSQQELVATGECVEDTWAVVGQYVTDEDRLRVQRSWLMGLQTRRTALVLQFATAGAAFAEALLPGVQFGAKLLFYPGAYPQRARIAERTGDAQAIRSFASSPAGDAGRPLPPAGAIETFLDDVAHATAHNPFMERFLCMLGGVVPMRTAIGKWQVQDGRQALPLAKDGHWRLLALSGGHPVDLAGEWDGHALLPLAASVRGEYHLLPVA